MSVFCAPVAALGGLHRDLVPRELREELRERLGVLRLRGQEDVLRPGPALGIILPHEAGDGLAVLLQRLLHELEVLGREVAADEVEHREAALGPAVKAHGVRVRVNGGDDALAVAQALDGPDAVPVGRGELELQLLRGGEHLLRQFLGELLCLAAEDHGGLLHGGVVFLRRVPGHAPSGAGTHVIVEAGPLLADVARELPRAGGQQQGFADRVYDVPRLRPSAEGAEIARPVLGVAVRERERGVLAAGVEADVGIALVIL